MRDYQDPDVEQQWCEERRAEVTAYLQREGVEHGRVAEVPAWHVAPYVSIWARESKKRPDWIGWWVICGDVPTDYTSAAHLKHPREAMRAIAEEWRNQANLMATGERQADIYIGRPEHWASLAPLLETRASMLLEGPMIIRSGRKSTVANQTRSDVCGRWIRIGSPPDAMSAASVEAKVLERSRRRIVFRPEE